jgi:tetratricopeptide (TPR) repeat protein
MLQVLDKISTKVLRIVPFLLSFLVPLFFLPTTSDYFAFNKYFLIAVIGTISLIAWCVRNLTRGKLHFTTSPALLPLVFLVIANIISSVWLSSTPHVSLFGQTSLFFFLAIIFITVTSSQKNRFTIDSAIYGFIASASFLSIFTLLHYFGLITRVFGSAIVTDRYFNPSGSILPALSFTLPILIATTIYSTGVKNWVQKSILFASVLLMIVGSIINISLILPQNGVPVISILPVAAGWSIAVDILKTWKTALLGTGPETFLSAFTRLRPAYLNLDKNIWDIRFSESSNFLFTLLTTTGLIGAFAFLLVFIRPLIVAIKNRRHFEEKSSLNFILTALIVTFISFLLIPTGIVSLTMGVVLLICLTLEFKLNNLKTAKDVTFSLSANSSSASVYHDLGETTVTTTSSFLPWLIIFLSVALLSAYWFFAGKMYLASMYYKQATAQAQTDPYGSFLKYQKASQTDTYNTYYQQKMSQIYLAVSDAYLSKKDATADDKTNGSNFAQNALDAGKLAAQMDPSNVTTWENLFSVYKTLIPYAQGSSDMAISHGLQAASLDPTNPTLYLQIGTLIYNLGDSDQAIKYIDRASELKQDWNIPYLNLATIYQANKDYARALQYAQAGLKYTDTTSADYKTVQDEITALQKLAPTPTPTATGSASLSQ